MKRKLLVRRTGCMNDKNNSYSFFIKVLLEWFDLASVLPILKVELYRPSPVPVSRNYSNNKADKLGLFLPK